MTKKKLKSPKPTVNKDNKPENGKVPGTGEQKPGNGEKDNEIQHLKDSEGKYRELTESLRLSEKRLKEAERVAKMGYYEIDLQTGSAKWSEETFRIFGLDPAVDHEANLDTYADYLHPDDVKLLYGHFSKAIEEKQPFDLEYRIKAKDGQIKNVHSKGEIITDASGKASKMFGTFQDVTAKKQLEITLHESEERFRLTFDQSPMGAAIVSLDYKFIRVNEAFCRITGYNKKELQAKTFLEITHPADIQHSLADNTRLLNGEVEHLSKDKRYIRKDNSIIWVHLSVRMMKDIYGNPRYFLPTFEDITYQRQVREKLTILSKATEQSPVSILITDCKGNIEYVNPKYEELTGYSLRESIGKNPRILKSGLTPVEVYTDLWNTITSLKDWKGELLNKKKNGELYYESVTISCITDETGQITHFVAVKEDISERKKLK
jgi:PAS domain S-box-containing protein